MVYTTRQYMEDITKKMGYKTGEYCGRFYINKGEYRIYVVNMKEYSNPSYDRSIIKEHHFEWVVKRASEDMKEWDEIFRTGVVYLTNELYQRIPNDFSKLENIIAKDKELMASKFNKDLANVARKFGLDLNSKNVRDALQMAYELGQRK